MKTLFTKVTDLSNHTGPFAKFADRLLSRVAPQQSAVGLHCRPIGCCSSGLGRFRCYAGGRSYAQCRNPTCW